MTPPEDPPDTPALPQPPEAPASAGLCAACRHARVITSARESVFVLCERSRTDPAFARYPRLPVLECIGFEPVVTS